jgi:hypothetical protein
MCNAGFVQLMVLYPTDALYVAQKKKRTTYSQLRGVTCDFARKKQSKTHINNVCGTYGTGFLHVEALCSTGN